MKTTLLGSALSGINIPAPTQTVQTAETSHHPPAPIPTPQQSTGLTIPNAFGAMATIPGADELPEGSSIYGVYSSSRSKNYDKYLKAGASEGDAVINIEGNLVVCKPLKFFLAAAFGCRSKMENDGNISAVSLDIKNYTQAIKDEHFACLILAFVNGSLVPCKFDLRTTKSKAASETIRTLHQAMTPEWANLSPLHAATMSFSVPWGRVITEVNTTRKVSGSGLAYHEAIPSCRPANTDEMKLLTAAVQDEQFVETFKKIEGEYQKRVVELKSKVKVLGQ